MPSRTRSTPGRVSDVASRRSQDLPGVSGAERAQLRTAEQSQRAARRSEAPIHSRVAGLKTPAYARPVRIDLIAIVVDEYDPAIEFFADALGFELVQDSPWLTNDGRPKRWVVVRPPNAETGILLARADDEGQAAAVGKQVAGRV